MRQHDILNIFVRHRTMLGTMFKLIQILRAKKLFSVVNHDLYYFDNFEFNIVLIVKLSETETLMSD